MTDALSHCANRVVAAGDATLAYTYHVSGRAQRFLVFLAYFGGLMEIYSSAKRRAYWWARRPHGAPPAPRTSRISAILVAMLSRDSLVVI